MKLSLYITDVENKEDLEKTIDSAKNIKILDDILIIIEKSNTDIVKNNEKLTERYKNKHIALRFINNKINRFAYIEKCKNSLVYQIQSGNLVSKKTIKFLNNENNLNYIKWNEIYIPSSVKFYKILNKKRNIFYSKKIIKFLNQNLHMNTDSVVHEITSRVGEFKKRPLKTILGNGNFLFFKDSFLKYCHKEISSNNNKYESYELFIIFLFLKNKFNIVFDKNFFHHQNLHNFDKLDKKNTAIKQNSIYQVNKIINISKKSNKPTKPQKYYFLTYGTKNFRVAKSHILSVANRSGIFDKCIGCDSSSLSKEFKREFNHILKLKRGAGYWIWKHEIILGLLNKVSENDIVVYSDAGSSFNYFAKDRFEEYLEMLNDSNYGNFRIECESIHKEKDWTTKELFNYFNIDPLSKIGLNTQLEATHMIFKKNEHTRNYFEEYKKVLKHDPLLITDKYNSNNQIYSFKENRHDQSIFSLLTKKYGGVVINNETEFKSSINQQFSFPFLAVRKHGHGIKDTLKYVTNFKGINELPVYFK